MTTTDHWVSPGNSIFESSRVEGVERIFVFFGKFGGDFDVKFRPYQDCLSSIKVTHSPRYIVDMNVSEKENIFKKMSVDYDAFRKEEDMVKRVKNYYRKQLKDGEELWWIDEKQERGGVSPIIRPFNRLSSKEKNEFIVDSMILFPEMFGNSTLKFERAAAYLVTEYSAVSSNLRDVFTAGGREVINIESEPSEVPRIQFHLHKQAKEIKERIEKIDEAKLMHYWRVKKLSSDRMPQWGEMLPDQDSEYMVRKTRGGDKNFSIFQIFESGL